jgi:hypothetical protein
MDARDSREGAPSDPGAAADHERSRPDVEAAMRRAEEGSEVEGRHTLDESGPSGDSRLERMRDVDEITEGRRDGVDEPDAPSEPSTAGTGSGGAQRIEGPRVSDRRAAGLDDEPQR